MNTVMLETHSRLNRYCTLLQINVSVNPDSYILYRYRNGISFIILFF